jgi:hypothetical protein
MEREANGGLPNEFAAPALVRLLQDDGVPTDRGFTARDVRTPFLFSEPRNKHQP